jgi:hypothetical protein
MILSRQSSRNQTGFHSLGIAENTVRLPLVKVTIHLLLELINLSKIKDKKKLF